MLPRREFLKSALIIPGLAAAGTALVAATAQGNTKNPKGGSLKTSLNAFSFNDALLKKTMSLDDLLEFCSSTGFHAVDITGYYFPGYPSVPDDAFLYDLKRKAFLRGLDISGTGVRNDFTEPDKARRAEHVTLVKNWIEAASKAGIPVVRIFAGTKSPAGFTREQVTDWLLTDVNECLNHGKKYGVIVAIQNHNDFIKTADQAIEIIKRVNSEWFGLILDTGSYRTGDPYDEIARTAPYAVNWQIKEAVFIGGKEVPTDIPRLIKIIKDSGYKGYLPLETLGSGDPKMKVKALYDQVVKALG